LQNRQQVTTYSLTAAILAGHARLVNVDIHTSPCSLDIYNKAKQELTLEQVKLTLNNSLADAIDKDVILASRTLTHNTNSNKLLLATLMQLLYRVLYKYSN
jgi:hypothetical protein